MKSIIMTYKQGIQSSSRLRLRKTSGYPISYVQYLHLCKYRGFIFYYSRPTEPSLSFRTCVFD